MMANHTSPSPAAAVRDSSAASSSSSSSSSDVTGKAVTANGHARQNGHDQAVGHISSPVHKKTKSVSTEAEDASLFGTPYNWRRIIQATDIDFQSQPGLLEEYVTGLSEKHDPEATVTCDSLRAAGVKLAHCIRIVEFFAENVKVSPAKGQHKLVVNSPHGIHSNGVESRSATPSIGDSPVHERSSSARSLIFGHDKKVLDFHRRRKPVGLTQSNVSRSLIGMFSQSVMLTDQKKSRRRASRIGCPSELLRWSKTKESKHQSKEGQSVLPRPRIVQLPGVTMSAKTKKLEVKSEAAPWKYNPYNFMGKFFGGRK